MFQVCRCDVCSGMTTQFIGESPIAFGESQEQTLPLFSRFVHRPILTHESTFRVSKRPPLLHQRCDAQWAAGAALDFHREGGDVAAGRGEFIQGCDIFKRRDVLCHQDLVALKEL